MATLRPSDKVFGVGLSRTGTTSLAEALNMLGINTIHFPSDQATYDELRSGTYRLSILDTYQGVVDIPVAPYYAQFDKVYPGSKFILTVREVGSWLGSVERHWRLWRDRDPHKDFTDFICACVYGTHGFNADRFRYAYETHRRNVCDYFENRPADLLVMNISAGEGWEILCPFLGSPVPDCPFPRLNTKEANQTWFELSDFARRDITALIPLDSAFILVDDMKLGPEVVGDRPAIPFLERGGLYWGRPLDDGMAVRELERLRRSGASFMVFAWPSFWWLHHYPALRRHLESTFRRVLENDRLIVFDLRRRLPRRSRSSSRGPLRPKIVPERGALG